VSMHLSHFALRDRAVYFVERNTLIMPKFKYLVFFILIPLLVTLSPAQWAFPQVFWVFCAQQMAAGSLIVVSVLHSCDTASSNGIWLSNRNRTIMALWILLAYFLPLVSAEMLGMILLDVAKVVSIQGIDYPTWTAIGEHCEDLLMSLRRQILISLLNGEMLIGYGASYLAVFLLSRQVNRYSRAAGGFFAMILTILIAQSIAFWMTYPFPRPFDLREYILGGPHSESLKPWSALVPLALIVVHGIQILYFFISRRSLTFLKAVS
jgi:hypothetical protein